MTAIEILIAVLGAIALGLVVVVVLMYRKLSRLVTVLYDAGLIWTYDGIKASRLLSDVTEMPNRFDKLLDHLYLAERTTPETTRIVKREAT